MIQLRCLGRCDVVGIAPPEREAVLRGGKRLALLAYLALAKHEVVRRDELVGVFWPEKSEVRARAALRQSLYFLRRHLGHELIRTVGQDGVSLQHSAVVVDALEFLERIARGELETAMAMYRGELLEGVIVTNEREVDLWLSAKRYEFRRKAIAASLEVARRADTAGEPAMVSHWMMRAAQLSGYDEAVVISAAHALVRLGDEARLLELADLVSRTDEGIPSALAEAASAIRRRRNTDPAAKVEDELIATSDRWMQACRDSDWDVVADLVVPDAVMLPPQEPIVRGRDAIRAWMRERPPVLEMEHEPGDIHVYDEVAWMNGIVYLRAAVAPGQGMSIRYSYQNVCRQQADGSWKLESIAWTPESPGPVF